MAASPRFPVFVRSAVRGLMCALGLAATAAVGQAQTAPADAPQVEIYVGVRRINPPPPVQPVAAETKPAPPAAPPAEAAAAKGAPAAPPVYFNVQLPPISYEPGYGGAPVVQAAAVTAEPEPYRTTAPVQAPAVTAPTAAPVAPPAPLPAAVAAAPAVPDNAPAPRRSAPSEPWLDAAAAQFAGTLAALALCAGGYLLLGRRRRAPEQTAVRVELVNVPTPVPAAHPASQASPVPDAPPAPEANPQPAPPEAAPAEPRREETLVAEAEKKFDIGPSYDDERRAAEEARRRAVDAILAQIVEQNVALRRQRAAQAASA